MNARESMRFVMFGAAAALFVAGGLTVGQMMGARPLQSVQAAPFQAFDYVTQKSDPPSNDEKPGANDSGDPGSEADPTTTPVDPTVAPPTPSTGSIGSGSSVPTAVPPTQVPEDEGSADPPAPTEEPAQPPAPPTSEPTTEPTTEPTEEPEDAAPEVTPEPDPDPEPPAGGGVIQLDPCILNPYGPTCDGGVNPVPPLQFHPCTWTDDPCPGEEPEDGPIVVVPINPCLLVDCEESITPRLQVGPIIEPPVPTYQFILP
ncbi:MAG: hypothetical protein KC491_09880 [Dehalococcoidia bacterium]|nr:hypothetical protein [Dehalococcoidia bacterium]